MRGLAVGLLALVALGCGEPRSYLVVVLDAEPTLLASVDALELAIRGPTRERPIEHVDPAVDVLPMTFALEAEGALEPLVLEARALAGGAVRVRRRVRTGFVRGEIRVVTIRLEAACEGELCGDTTTCVAGACVDDGIAPADLPPWGGQLGRDAGAPPGDAGLDGGPSDATIDAPSDGGDAGPPPFEALPGPIAAGHHHTCAVEDARLWCWGGGDDGQDGGAMGATAVQVLLPRVAGVCAGMYFTCAWTLDGEAWCFGRMGSEAAPVFRSESRRAMSLPARARMIACGFDHACALLDDGRVACAGVGTAGQLGDGLTTSASIDAAVVAALPSRALRVAAGEGTTCAHLETGELMCWGDNDLLRAGAPMSLARVTTPRVVDSMPVELASTSALAGGGGHTCAVAGGQVYCWGANTHGERGCLSTNPRAIATPVPGASDGGASELALGLDHTCVVVDGVVHCAGEDFYGQTGRDPESGASDCTVAPVTELAGETATAVAAGRFHTCALLASGEIACWGLNQSGQLGASGAGGWRVRRSRLP